MMFHLYFREEIICTQPFFSSLIYTVEKKKSLEKTLAIGTCQTCKKTPKTKTKTLGVRNSNTAQQQFKEKTEFPKR